MTETPEFDRLADALFAGPTKLVDLIVVPGTDPGLTTERLSASLYASMERVGLIVEGRLTDRFAPGRADGAPQS